MIASIIIQILSGLSMAMVLFIVAAGLCLIFGTLKVLNFAHGSFFMLGAYLCLTIVAILPNHPLNFWVALIVSPIVVGFIGGIVEVLIFRRIYKFDHIFQLLLSFALILIISDVVKLIWSAHVHPIGTPWPLRGSITILDRIFPIYNVFLIIAGPIILISLLVLINKTRLGRVIRAVTYNIEMAGALGHNVPMIYTTIFMLGCALGGMGGVLIAPLVGATPGMDMTAIIDCFVIIVIGGMGSYGGAFLAAIILGLLNAFGIIVLPKIALAFGFLLMAIVLIFRPWGLMGKEE